MEKIPCARCGHVEFIPTYHFVKFDLILHYLCVECYGKLHTWFRKGKNLHLDSDEFDGPS